MSANNSNNLNDSVNDYIKGYADQLKQAEKYIQEIKDAESKIQKDQKAIADEPTWYGTHRYFWGLVKTHWVNHKIEKEVHAYQADIKAQQSIINAAENALSNMPGLGAGFAALFNTLNNMNSGETDMSSHADGANVHEQLQDIQKYLDQIFQLMENRLQANLYETILAKEGGSMSIGDQEQIALKIMSLQSGSSSLLGALLSAMQDDAVKFNKIHDDAKADKSRYNKLDEWFGDGYEQEDRLQRVMDAASKMMKVITQAIGDLAPEMGNLTPEFVMVNLMLRNVMNRVAQILADPTMSPQQKAGQILANLFSMLNILDIVKGEVESRKSNNEQFMSKGSLSSAEMKMQDAKMNAQILHNELHNAYVMKVFATVMIALLAAIMCATGQVEMMPFIIGFAAYDIAATWDKAPDMGEKLGGGVGGQVAWSAIETVATPGLGGALQRIIAEMAENAAAAAAEVAVRVAMGAIKAAVQEAVESAVKTAIQAAEAAGKTVSREMMQEAAQKAIQRSVQETLDNMVRGASKLYAKQSIGTLCTQSMKKTMEKLMSEAAQDAIKSSASLAEKAAMGIHVADKEFADLAKTVAVRVLKNLVNVSEQVAKDAIERSWVAFIKETSKTAGANFTIAALSNNVLVDGSEAIYKKIHGHGSENDQAFTDFKYFLQALQALLMMMVAQYQGGAVQSSESSTGWMRVMNALQAGATGAQGANSYAQGDNLKARAKTQKEMEINHMLQDSIYQLLERMQKISEKNKEAASEEISSDGDNTRFIARHFNDGLDQGLLVQRMQAV